MNKYNSNITNGVPFYWDDIEFIQNAYKDAFYGFLSGVARYKNDKIDNISQDDMILNGCWATEVDTGSGSIITVSNDFYNSETGYISINGEICQVDEHIAEVDTLGGKWSIVETYESGSTSTKTTQKGTVVYPYLFRKAKIVQRGSGDPIYTDVKHFTEVLADNASFATRQYENVSTLNSVDVLSTNDRFIYHPAYPHKKITLRDNEHYLKLTNYSGSIGVDGFQCQIVNIEPPENVYDGYELIINIEPQYVNNGIGFYYYPTGNDGYHNLILDVENSDSIAGESTLRHSMNMRGPSSLQSGSFNDGGYEKGHFIYKFIWDSQKSEWILLSYSKTRNS